MKAIIARRKSSIKTNITPSLPNNLHPVLKQIYLNRNIYTAEDLNKSLQNLLPHQTLLGITTATNRIYNAIFDHQKILIIGDFDADGATSTAICMKALRLFGAKNVNFLVPDRFKFGYGLSPEIVTKAKQDYAPDLIITVDNGISSIDGVTKANSLNIDVVITDHHLAADTLPPAFAIVNPNQPGDKFESKNLAGVGVIFYVLLALRIQLREKQWFKNNNLVEPNLASLLDIVALGTVADVVALDHNNRILVDQGLRRIRAGLASPGIKALIEVSNRDQNTLSASDLGFCLAPRLNAAGRLEDMSIGINCLLSENDSEALVLAKKLNQLNQERKSIESQMQSDALQILKKLENNIANQNGICLYDSTWHQGVIGILASRIKDQYHRPVIVFANGENGEIKGSARSINGIHIRDVLDSIASQHPKLISKFGGHAMAAGLTIMELDFIRFNEIFDKEITALLSNKDIDKIIYTDCELAENDYSLELANLLKHVEPWGQAFPEPKFEGKFHIVDHRIVGEKHLKLKLSMINDSSREIDAIAFNQVNENNDINFSHSNEILHAVFKLDINEYNNRKTLQLIIDQFEVTPQSENCM